MDIGKSQDVVSLLSSENEILISATAKFIVEAQKIRQKLCNPTDNNT